MKTFEEACRATFVQHVGAEPTPETTAAAMDRAKVAHDRYRAVTDEIELSPMPHLLFDAIVDRILEGKADLHNALLTAFINGICVGMEMQRPDELSIATESVPGRRESKGYTGV